MPKPFDLQKALAGKPVLGQDLKPVRRLIHVPERTSEWKILVVFYDGACGWYHEDGTTSHDEPLTMADPPKKKIDGWINIYKGCERGDYYPGGYLHNTEQYARDCAKTDETCVGQAYATFEVEED